MSRGDERNGNDSYNHVQRGNSPQREPPQMMKRGGDNLQVPKKVKRNKNYGNAGGDDNENIFGLVNMKRSSSQNSMSRLRVAGGNIMKGNPVSHKRL